MLKMRKMWSDVINFKDGLETGQDTESPVPLHVRQSWWVPEPFGERITIDLQFGDLENSRYSVFYAVPHSDVFIWAAFCF